MRKGFNNVIIDTPERFIGRFKQHRISIIEIQKPEGNQYSIDVTDRQDNFIVEANPFLASMEEAINFAIIEAKL
jgi:hypothetical protein